MLNRAGKAKGVHKMWKNIQLIPDGKQISVNFDKIKWKNKEESVLLMCENSHDVMEAKSVELENLKENKVF